MSNVENGSNRLWRKSSNQHEFVGEVVIVQAGLYYTVTCALLFSSDVEFTVITGTVLRVP